MSIAGTNNEQTRPYNRRVVMETVRLHQPVSRAEIARLTGLTPQAVSKITADLEAAGLLLQRGRRRTRRGQPPVDITINPEGGFTIGLQLVHGGLRAVLVDLAGSVRSRREAAFADPSPGTAIPVMADTVTGLLRKQGIAPATVLGVGLVLPGPLDMGLHDHRDPTTIPGWDSAGPAATLAERLGLPVLIDNDATAAAVGERFYGAARLLRSFVYVFLGAGLGAGLILDGRPFKGHCGNAGELGHLIVEPGGLPCYCGNRGCLERYVSMHALEERLAAAGRPAATEEAVRRLLADGDDVLAAWLAEAADKLRIALNGLENLLDPEAVLIGGHLPPALMDALFEHLTALLPSVSARAERSGPRLLRATAGVDVSALGAAALPVFNVLSPTAHQPPRVTDPSVHPLEPDGTGARQATA